jgi:hypothetical protein
MVDKIIKYRDGSKLINCCGERSFSGLDCGIKGAMKKVESTIGTPHSRDIYQ